MRKFVALAAMAGTLSMASAQEPLLAPVPAPTLEAPPILRPDLSAQLQPPLNSPLQPAPQPPSQSPLYFPPQTRNFAPVPSYAPAPLTATPYVMPERVPSVSPLLVEPGTIICDANQGYGIPLYPRVRVTDPRRIHPHAISKIVAVPDPNCDRGCVFIKICVPPCVCEQVVCRKGKIRFIYGRHVVEVSQRRGVIRIDYDA